MISFSIQNRAITSHFFQKIMKVFPLFAVTSMFKNHSLLPPSFLQMASQKALLNLQFKHWLNDHNYHDICMESTGKYWIPVFNILEDS